MKDKIRDTIIIISALFLLSSHNLYAQQIDLAWDLIGRFPLDNSANDMSGYDNHGAVTGAIPSEDRTGAADKAYFFDGVDDYILISPEIGPISSALTVSCWIKANDALEYGHFISKYDFESDAGFSLGIQNGKVRWAGRNGSGTPVNLPSVSMITDNQWHHLIGIIDGSTWTLYVDGNLENQINTGYRRTNLSTYVPLTIGMYFNGDNGNHRFFTGSVDGIHIYKRAISACEIEALYLGFSFWER